MQRSTVNSWFLSTGEKEEPDAEILHKFRFPRPENISALKFNDCFNYFRFHHIRRDQLERFVFRRLFLGASIWKRQCSGVCNRVFVRRLLDCDVVQRSGIEYPRNDLR